MAAHSSWHKFMPIEHIFQTAFWFSIKLIGHGPRNLMEQQGWNLVLDKPSKSLNVLPITAKWGSSLIQFVENKGFVVLSKTVLVQNITFRGMELVEWYDCFLLSLSPPPLAFSSPASFHPGSRALEASVGAHTRKLDWNIGVAASLEHTGNSEKQKRFWIWFLSEFFRRPKTCSQSSEFWRLKRFTQAVSPCQKWL